MPVSEPQPSGAHELLQDIHAHFEALLSKIELALEQLPPDAVDGEDGRRLQRAKVAAERGAALARDGVRRKRS
jgi:hypothetical protein